MDIQKLQALIYELRNLKDKTDIYRENNDWIYTNIYKNWINEYNSLLKKYDAITELKINPMNYNDFDLSSTGKTVKDSALDYFSNTLASLANKISNDIEQNRRKQKEIEIPLHQMRTCFKLGAEGCPLNPKYEKNKVFIGMPFDDSYLDSYNYGIIPALDSLGLRHYRADNEISNKDIMCKICKEIQSCSIGVINISGLNPNVMLEQGLLYGLGKPVIIIKDKDTKAITDLGSLEYIEYNHAHDLMKKLVSALEK